MTYSEPPKHSRAISHMLFQHYMQGPAQAAVVTLLYRLTMEVEALREALSSPQTPDAVRAAYRRAYERKAVESHNSAGPTGGTEKILDRFFPWEAADDRFAPELVMMARLGATLEEQQELRENMKFHELLS